MAFYDSFIEEIRQKAEIVELISDYVKLELKGKNHSGLCPFHQEKTPSFTVSRDKQLYYCFGCGAGGDIFNFLMSIENISFFEAAKILAEHFNIPIPEKNNSSANRKSNEIREKLFEIHEWTAKFYQYLLTNHQQGENARKYFTRRGFSDLTIEKFRLGYAPDAWTALFNFLKNKGYPDHLLEKSGLVLPGKKKDGFYDRFRDRAIFTIFNLRSQPIGFGGRVLVADKLPKYLNSPETLLFEKNKNLYGLNFARDFIRKTKKAIIVEGYTDVITAHLNGVENVIASLGTALTENQARLLARYADEVFIAYDADTAGQSATLRGLDILKKEGLIVKVIKLPDNTDPDELISEHGAQSFLNLLDHAISLIDFKLEQIIREHDISTPGGKVNVVHELLSLFLSINNAIEKDYLLNQIVQRIGVSRQALEEELVNFIKEKSKIKDRKEKKWHTIKESDSKNLDAIEIFEAKFICAMFKFPEKISEVFSVITPKVFKNLKLQKIVAQLFAYYQALQKSNNLSALTTSNLVENISDNELKSMILDILFKHQDFITSEDYLNEGLNKIKEYQKAMEMETILKEIKQIKTNGDLKSLNETLIRYHYLLHKNGKGGC